MAETHHSVGTQDSRPATLSSEADVRTTGEPGLAGLAATLTALAEEVASHRNQVRDLEKSLIERIADVDDDRRTTASQLQRGWNTQREEMESRFRQQWRLGAIALLLLATVAVAALIAAFLRVQGSQTALERGLERTVAVENQNGVLQEKLETLSSSVGRLSATVRELAGGLPHAEQRPGPPDIAPLAAEIERVSAEQARMERQLLELRDRLATQPRPGPTTAALAAPAEAASVPDVTRDEPPPEPLRPARESIPQPMPGAGLAAETAPAGSAGVDIAAKPFALQIMGSHRREAVEELAARSAMPDRVYIREETRRNRPWFVLIYGLYPSRAEAKAALEALPPQLRTLRPWVRTLPADAVLEATGRGGAP